MRLFFGGLILALVAFVAVLLIVSGMLIIKKQHPLIYRTKWNLLIQVFLIIVFSYQGIDDMYNVMLILILLCSLLRNFFALKGYSFSGVKGAEFKKVLLQNLEGMGFDLIVLNKKIIIRDPRLEIKLYAESWSDECRIHQIGKANHELFKTLVNSLKSSEFQINKRTPRFLIIFGICLFIVCVIMGIFIIYISRY